MGFNVIGYKGADTLAPAQDFSQNSGQQYILRMRSGIPVNLMSGQVFILPVGQWSVSPGRYTHLQWYDGGGGRWRNYPNQPGQQTTVSSDGTNFRLANTTGTPVGALITNVGAGNATNGYNTVGVTASAGNSTWGTLVGGSVNVNCNVTTGGNYSLPPLIMWTPAGNQTIPFFPPMFNCTITSANGALATISCVDQGAGLTGVGTLTVVQQPGDTNPGGGVVNIGANALANSGNLTALWPLTPGQNGNGGLASIPTLAFNVGGGMAATAIMNFVVKDAVGQANVGANAGSGQMFAIISVNGTANAVAGGAANALVANSVNDFELWPPRMAWLSSNTNAALQFSNANLVIHDAGLNLQAIPILAVIPANNNGNSGASSYFPGVFTAAVGGRDDQSYIQAL